MDNQTNLPSWKDEAERNHRNRLDWKVYLNGKSMNVRVAELAAEKKCQSSIEKVIEIEATLAGAANYVDLARLQKLIHIGVGARLAEMSMEKTTYKAVLASKMTWRAQARIMANGTGYVFIARDVNIRDGQMLELTAVVLDAPAKG